MMTLIFQVFGILQIFVVLLDVVKTGSEIAAEEDPPLTLLVSPIVLAATLVSISFKKRLCPNETTQAILSNIYSNDLNVFSRLVDS